VEKNIEDYIKCLEKRIKYLQTSTNKDSSSIEMYALEIVIEDLKELGESSRFSYWTAGVS